MMHYDHAIVDKWRAKAITTVEKLTSYPHRHVFYSNNGSDAFTLVRLLTNAEHWKADNFPYTYDGDAPDEIAWMEIDSFSRFAPRSHSLKDCNIGASYNPWLVFDNKEDRDAYEAELEITYTRDHWDDWDDWDD